MLNPTISNPSIDNDIVVSIYPHHQTSPLNELRSKTEFEDDNSAEEDDFVPDNLYSPSQSKSVPSLEPSPAWSISYISMCSATLFKASLNGDWEAMEEIVQENPQWLRTGITKMRETILHIAAAAKHLRVVEEIIKRDPKSLLYTNKSGSSPFCFAVVSGVVNIAKVMVRENHKLPYIRSNDGMTPLNMAVLLGLRDMSWYLLEVTSDECLTDLDRIEILTGSINTNMLDVALHVLKNNLYLALLRDSKGMTALHALARKPLKECGGRRLSIWSMISSKRNGGKSESLEELELTKTLWEIIIQQSKEDISALIRQPWRLLFVATSLGKVEFLRILIQSYPDVIWKVDENGHSIFHAAVVYRQPEIFKLIYEIGAFKDLISTFKDTRNNNNMLHLAGKFPLQEHLNCVPGPALQMQRELQWFKAVKQIVRPEYVEAQNAEKITPQTLFSKEHEELRKQGEEWMKKTSESCALVAALVATMVFSTAYQLPGGINGDKGSPVLVRSTSFVFYAMSNAVSLFTSTASILMFLSILTSRYAERDFLESLPLKLMTGLISLLISMAMMIVSFTTTLFITFQEGLTWPPILIAVFASVPVILFALQQFPLLTEMYYSTYISKTMFQRCGDQGKLFNCISETTTTKLQIESTSSRTQPESNYQWSDSAIYQVETSGHS